jgi:hypothetical protein
MYCPVCFQNTLKIRSSGVVRISFNGKSRDTSIFTFNLNKDTKEELDKKLRERIVDFLKWYSSFQNKDPIKQFEAMSSDFQCSNNCKIDYLHTKLSVVGLIFSPATVKTFLQEECKNHGLELQLIKS